MRNARSGSTAFIFQIEPPSTPETRFASIPQYIYQCARSSQQLSMEDCTDAPKYLNAERSLLSPQGNLEVIDSSGNILSPISNLLNDRNMRQTPFSGPCPTSRRSESSNLTENNIISTAASTTRPKKEFHPFEKNKNRSSNPSPPSSNPSPHNPNSTAPSPAEPNYDSASQTPSEHSSGSDAAFYCSVGSPSEDEEDGSGASLALGEKEKGEGESGMMKSTLREAVSTSRTGVVTDDGGKGEEDEEDEEEEEEESNDTHNKNRKRRKSKKRYTFLRRIFSRKKARDSNGGTGGTGGIS
ncbi:hypothetical protein BGAL_0412g00100 [Botrytis galanthina]|uniref:Uncharacterized protein n=1 Tax=Botrytis galanthina TaxID=278940 RepID=A0A4S8QQU3_9HELO|nr:hypothetical protein BGAL_0412g00100 [Botrytis galanthina]